MCDMRQVDKAEYRRLLNEIAEDYCQPDKYCILKEFLVESHPSRRLLVQLKLVDKFKFIRSKDAGNDIGWDAALRSWMDEGHAIKFAEVYSDKKSVRDIFRQIIAERDQK